MDIILASASPRRRELMALITDKFTVMTADVDERALEKRLAGCAPDTIAMELGAAKARAVFDGLSEDERRETVVIGADTSVVIDDRILGKPADRDEAREMLLTLSGRSHSVITGVAIIMDGSEYLFAEQSFVEFAQADEYQRELIEKYISTNDPYDKAGGYGIQGGGALLVKEVQGDYFNVVGMPVMKVARKLYELGAIPG